MRPGLRPESMIDPATAERMLDGRVDADDLPSELAPVAGLLRAADAPIRADEVQAAPDAIRRIFEQARRPPVAPGTRAAVERPAGPRWSLRVAVAAVIAGFTLSGGAALAATGSLPAPVQSAAHAVLGVIGVDVPDAPVADPRPEGGTEPDGAGTPAPGAPPTSTPADIAEPPSTPPSTDAPAPDASVPGLGPEVCAAASDGQCRAGEDNPSVTRPSVPAPTAPTPPSSTPPVTAPPVTAPPVTVPDNPSETRPDNPSATRPDNPSATRPDPGNGKDK
jgi:hypothetical protein